MNNKLSELKYALECLEGAQYDGEWNSALVGGGGDGAEYPAVTNLAGVVVRTARLGPHEARLCEYLEAVSPSNIRALLAEMEAEKKSNVFLKEQLAQLANFNPDWDMLEACRESWREVAAALKEAEAKLATPVRLPDIRSDDYHETGWFQHMKYYRDVERSLRAAGFTVGDE